MHKLLLSVAILVCVGFNAHSQQEPIQQTDIFKKELYLNNGDTLRYRFLKPLSSSEQQLYPLVIFLHGAGERGNDNDVHIKHIAHLFTNEKNRTKYPCYVLAPQCPKSEMWARFDGEIETMKIRKTPTKPMKLLIDLIEKTIHENPIDTSRIYITGLSMGGFGTWDLISRYPQKFAAAVPVCGGGDASKVALFRHLPIWAFHGAKDNIVPPQHSRKMIAALQNNGALPGYNEYPDVAHASWVNAYREPMLLEWLFRQKKGNIGNN